MPSRARHGHARPSGGKDEDGTLLLTPSVPEARDPGAQDPDAATVALLRPLRAAMGITRLAEITHLDRIGLPVFAAMRPNARSVTVSQGKGLTRDAARVSALMEAVESWHAEHIAAPLRLAAAEELAGLRLVDLDRLACRAGRRPDRALPCLWVEGRTLVEGAGVWLPYEVAHTDYRLPQPPALGCYPVSSNGLGAGRTRAAALRHALCELIERDAYSLWQQLPPRARAATAVAPASVGDPASAAILGQLGNAGFASALFDLTGDLAVPAFLAVILDRRQADGHPGLGTACHPDCDVALRKALLEAVQVRTSYIAGARDDFAPIEFEPVGIAAKVQALEGLLRLAGEAPRSLAARAVPAGAPADDAPAQLAWLAARLAAAGMTEIVVLDLDRPEIGLPVVRVVVPGLEGCADDSDYRPGERALRLRTAA